MLLSLIPPRPSRILRCKIIGLTLKPGAKVQRLKDSPFGHATREVARGAGELGSEPSDLDSGNTRRSIYKPELLALNVGLRQDLQDQHSCETDAR